MIKLYKDKQKKGIVDRVVDNYTIIVKDLFDKDVNINQFIGKEIVLESGEVGKIEGSFGKSGKIRVAFK
jgi:selenocysteine-specific elongation factor